MTTEINAGSNVFTDKHGHKWDTTLTMLSARRVAASDFSELTEVAIDFLNPDQKMFAEVATKPSLAIAIVWAIVKPQYDAIRDKVNPLVSTGTSTTPGQRKFAEDEEAFLDALDGPAIAAAKEALWETLINFFPEQRTVMLHWRAATKSAQEKLTARIMGLMPQMTEQMDKFMDEEIDGAVTEFQNSMKRSLSAGS